MKHLGQDIIRHHSPLLSLVTTLPAATSATSNNTAVGAEETGATCHASARRGGAERWSASAFKSKTVEIEQKSGRRERED